MKQVILKFLSAAVLSVFLYSCTKKPEACISTPSLSAEVNDSVTFTDCSKNAEKLEWYILGKKYITGEVKAAFPSEGEYNVNLRVWSANEKKSDETSVTVSVIQPKGKVTFWSGESAYDTLTVTVSAHGFQKINKKISLVTQCGVAGCANFELPEGEHSYAATMKGIGQSIQEGTIIVRRNDCTLEEIR
jgi:hypothetical protein